MRAHATSDHAARAHRHVGHHEPAAQVPLGAAKHSERRPDERGHRSRARQRHEQLHAQRDAMALLDHRGEAREVRPVRLATRDARDLRRERHVRLTAGRHLRERASERRVTREARGRERGRAAGLVGRERRLQERRRLPILGLGDRAHARAVELAVE
jgi:hypothetical protein